MNQRIVLLLAIFLVLSPITNSINTFVIQETEKIGLEPNATDPDGDKLTALYSHPLNEYGEWQTNYGDAGEYKSTITVSDGFTNVSRDVLIIVNKKEESPTIDSFSPKEGTLNIKETDSINFKVSASDVNKDELSYEWFLDEKKVNREQEFSYHSDYNDAGTYKISVFVSDGIKTVSKEWTLKVENVDVESLIDDIKDVTVNENEIAKLELPDFEKYGLSYSISEPIGNKNEWKTTYNDEGTFEIKIHAEGDGINKDKIARVVVNNVDRPPVFEELDNKVINENEEFKMTLNAYDPDGDDITFSANNAPEGAKLEDNTFTWKPSYDTVKKEGLIDSIIDKFRILDNNFYIQFVASSTDKKIVQNVVITVKDINRAPVIEEMEPINISEGEILKIIPKVYDPDGDKVALSYSGFLKTDVYKSKFGDAGTYYAKIVASDGLLETSKFVQINILHVNRASVFEKIKDIKAREGDNIAILLNAFDPDGDEIIYSIDNPPEYSTVKGNAFIWTPSYDVAAKKETKRFDFVFVANDGKEETRQIAKVEISDKNRPPRIIDATKSVVTKIKEPVLMFVKAVDDDGDELTYTWEFGFLEKYKATATHQRIFTSRGIKAVKVIVSDGIDEVEQLINVNVV